MSPGCGKTLPALALKIYGKPLVFSTTRFRAEANAVLDRMTETYKSEYANVPSRAHYLANAQPRPMKAAVQVAKFSRRAHEEIVFTARH